MDPQLQHVLEKVARAGSTSALTDGDRQLIRMALGDEAHEGHAGPQPLWRWCSAAQFRFHDVMTDTFPRFDRGMAGVLVDAGAGGDASTNPLTRMTARVERKALVRAVRRQLGDKDGSQREIAAQLVGLAGLTELQAVLEDALESGQEAQQSDGRPDVVAAMLDSLVMLGSPVARTEGRRLLASPDRSVRSAAERAVLAGDEPLDDATLERVVKGSLKDAWFRLAPDAMARAIERGWIDAVALQGWVNEWHTPAAVMPVARGVLAAANVDALQVLCKSPHETDLRAVGWAAAFGSHDWALPALREALKRLAPTTVDARVLVTAIASHDFDALRAWLDTDHHQGALLGLVAWHGDRREAALQLLDNASSRCKDDPAIAEVVRSLLAPAADPDEVEQRWWRVSSLDDPWHALTLARAFEAYGWPIPDPAALWLATEAPQAVPSSQQLEALVEMARRDPTVLLQRLRDGHGSSPQWRRSAALLGLAGDARAVAAIGQYVATEDDREGCIHAVRSMAAGGIDLTHSVRARLSSCDYGETVVLQPGEETEALIAAVRGHDLGRTAGLSLNTVADRVSPFLRWQLASNDRGQRERAVQTAARVTSASDPHLADVAALANREAKRVDDLACPELLLASPADDVREMLATLVGRTALPLPDVAPLLLPLMNDEVEAVAWAALSSLASLAPDASWVTDLILERSRSQHWEAARRSAAVMARAPHPRFIARLTELADNDSTDYSARQSAVMALTRIAEEFPDRGLVVLDVRDPTSVQERYGLADAIDWHADRPSEARRLLLVAFDRRRREQLARRHAGKKVLFAAPDEINAGNPAHIDAATFEGLAMYFGVVFADEDTGSIIAEVRAEPSGEIINALLQTRSVAVARASWS